MLSAFDLGLGTREMILALRRSAIDFVTNVFPGLVAGNRFRALLSAQAAAVSMDGFLFSFRRTGREVFLQRIFCKKTE